MTITQDSGRETPEMVERVARALAVDDSCDPDFIDRAGRVQWTYHIGAARTAIASMREATKTMSEAGWLKSETADREWVSCTPRDLWGTMIDAALASRTGAEQDEGER